MVQKLRKPEAPPKTESELRTLERFREMQQSGQFGDESALPFRTNLQQLQRQIKNKESLQSDFGRLITQFYALERSLVEQKIIEKPPVANKSSVFNYMRALKKVRIAAEEEETEPESEDSEEKQNVFDSRYY